MIFVTGDMHGDYYRLRTESFLEQRTMTKEDYLIVCGDFGIWDDSKKGKARLDELAGRPFTTLFVDGNHENFELLSKSPVSEWHGGKVQFINDSVIHLMRGEVYDISGKRFFAMGGASSHDTEDGILEPDDPDFKMKKQELDSRCALYRVNHVSWWKEELPSDAEYETARRNLEACCWKVNFIITHCAPSGIVNAISQGLYASDQLTDFLEEIHARCSFDFWFCGHYHINYPAGENFAILYEQILQISG